jgi:hypothetical protein
LRGQEGVGAAASTANKARKSANFWERYGRCTAKDGANQAKADLYKCIAVPTPPNCPKSAQDLEVMNGQAEEFEKKLLKLCVKHIKVA